MFRSSFTITGDPIGKPTMTHAVKWKRTDGQERYFAWCDTARLAATGNPEQKIDNVKEGIFGLFAFAHIRMPESWSQKKKNEHAGRVCDQKPDKDNIEKSLNDALFLEDKRICVGGVVAKFWAHEDEAPRVDVFLLAAECVSSPVKEG